MHQSGVSVRLFSLAYT